MNVRKLLHAKGKDVVSVRSDATVQDAVAVMVSRNIGLVVVCDGANCVQGVFSERDLARLVSVHGGDALGGPVGEVMTRDVTLCRIDDSVDAAAEIMANGRFRHLPVVGGGQLAGIISSTDILRYLGEDATAAERAMIMAKIAWA